MTQAVVERVDHLTVLASPPKLLFRALSERLLLPVAWPVTAHRLYTSGGIHLGNLNLEVMQLRRYESAGDESTRRPRLHSIALQLSAFEESLPELDRRGIQHTPPAPYYIIDEQGWRVNAWTSVVLNGLLGGGPLAGIYNAIARRTPADVLDKDTRPRPFPIHFSQPFIYDRVYPTGMVSAVSYNPAWRAQHIREEPPAGGLELLRVYEITVGLRDYARAYPLWQALFEPLPELAPGVWALPDGLHIRLMDAAQAPGDTAARARSGITGMIWQVASLNRAAQFLHRRGIIGPEVDGQVAISPGAIGGLDVRLVQ